MRDQYPKRAIGPYRKFYQIHFGVYILEEDTCCI